MTIQATPPALEEPSVTRLVVDLRDDVATLVEQEFALAKAELAEKAKNLAMGAAFVGAAAVVAVLSVVALTAAFIFGLAQLMPTWLAASCVTLLYLLAAVTLVAVGKRRLRRIGGALPMLTVHRIKEDLRWLRRRAL